MKKIVVEIAVLCLGSWLGVLTRIALQLFYQLDNAGSEVFPAMYAQIVGCAVIAITVRYRARLLKWYAPAVLGITTGFTGSLTTFSSWMISRLKLSLATAQTTAVKVVLQRFVVLL